MTKNIAILSISHSFLRKINTRMHSILKNEYKLNVKLICPQSHIELKKPIYPDFKPNEIDINISFHKTIFNHLRLKIYKSLFYTIKKEKITHIFLDMDIISLQSIILIFYSYIFKYKVCFFSNENNIINEKSILKKKIKTYSFKTVNFFFSSRILKIFCYTNQIKRNLDYCGFQKKTIVTPLGFDKRKFNRQLNLKDKEKFVISYFGKIEPKKGIHTLLKALLLLNMKDWIFYLDVFDIHSLDYYRLIKKDLSLLMKNNKLKLIKCSHNNINKFMQNTDLSIVPSEWNEQYGRVIQESIACGSIVIGSNIGAIPEILIDKDFIFETKNEISLKNKIEEIYFNYDYYRKKFNVIEKFVNTNRTVETQAELIKKNIL